MKIKALIEPERFNKVLNTITCPPLLDSTTVKFTKDCIEIEDFSLGTIAIKGEIDKSFFLEYPKGITKKKEREIKLKQSWSNNITKYFKDKSINIEFEEKKMIIKGDVNTYSETLEESTMEDQIIDLGINIKKSSKYGFEFDIPYKIRLLINQTELSNLPIPGDDDAYLLEYNGKFLIIKSALGTGDFEKKVAIKSKDKPNEDATDEDISFSFEYTPEYFNAIVKQLEGDCWITIAENGPITFSLKEKGRKMIYLLAPVSEEEFDDEDEDEEESEEEFDETEDSDDDDDDNDDSDDPGETDDDDDDEFDEED